MRIYMFLQATTISKQICRNYKSSTPEILEISCKIVPKRDTVIRVSSEYLTENTEL